MWCDMIYDMIWYDMMWCDVIYDMIYLLTTIGLTPGGSSTAHIYTHRQYLEQYHENRIYGTEHK